MGIISAIIRLFGAVIRRTLFFISSVIAVAGLVVIVIIVIAFLLTLIEPLLGLPSSKFGLSLQKELYKLSSPSSSYLFFKCVIGYLAALLLMFFTRKRKNR